MIFIQHYDRVDRGDYQILRYKTGITSLDVSPAESYYLHDPRKVLIY
jgi:hypothetical protein